jgi:serine/threonine protein kinase
MSLPASARVLPSEAEPIAYLFEKGYVIEGKYRVEKLLGVGGMGAVVGATHLGLNQRVAIKFLLPYAARDKDVIQRFLREGQAASEIGSEHVARVYDVGTLGDGTPFLVMEYLEGENLGEKVEASGPLPIADAVDWILEACEALAEAHAAGIVHRDLKPGNLFLARRKDGSRTVKVIDFGISKVKSASAGMLTQSRATMGSPSYMSPEQLQSSRDVDPRSDVWSLGVTLYELLTNRFPFEGETIHMVTMRIVHEQPVSPRSYRPEMPAGLEAVLLACLTKDISLRFRNVGKLAAALAPYGSPKAATSLERISGVLQSAGHSVPPPNAISQIEPTIADSNPRIPITATPRTFAETPSGSGRWIALGIVVPISILALGIAGFVMTRARREPAIVPAPSVAAEPLPPPIVTAAAIEPAPSTTASTASSAAVAATSIAPARPRPPTTAPPRPSAPRPPASHDPFQGRF